jgi:hypothetical protein
VCRSDVKWCENVVKTARPADCCLVVRLISCSRVTLSTLFSPSPPPFPLVDVSDGASDSLFLLIAFHLISSRSPCHRARSVVIKEPKGTPDHDRCTAVARSTHHTNTIPCNHDATSTPTDDDQGDETTLRPAKGPFQRPDVGNEAFLVRVSSFRAVLGRGIGDITRRVDDGWQEDGVSARSSVVFSGPSLCFIHQVGCDLPGTSFNLLVRMTDDKRPMSWHTCTEWDEVQRS